MLRVTAEKCGWREPRTIATFSGDRLEGTVFQHPLLERDSLGILADHVTLEQGTGAVHTAPGHGQEDYAIGQKYGIPTFCPVAPAGRRLLPAASARAAPSSTLTLPAGTSDPAIHCL